MNRMIPTLGKLSVLSSLRLNSSSGFDSTALHTDRKTSDLKIRSVLLQLGVVRADRKKLDTHTHRHIDKQSVQSSLDFETG